MGKDLVALLKARDEKKPKNLDINSCFVLYTHSNSQQQDLKKLRKVADHAGLLKRHASKRPASSSKVQTADPSSSYQPPILVSIMPMVNAVNLWVKAGVDMFATPLCRLSLHH